MSDSYNYFCIFYNYLNFFGSGEMIEISLWTKVGTIHSLLIQIFLSQNQQKSCIELESC